MSLQLWKNCHQARSGQLPFIRETHKSIFYFNTCHAIGEYMIIQLSKKIDNWMIIYSPIAKKIDNWMIIYSPIAWHNWTFTSKLQKFSLQKVNWCNSYFEIIVIFVHFHNISLSWPGKQFSKRFKPIKFFLQNGHAKANSFTDAQALSNGQWTMSIVAANHY